MVYITTTTGKWHSLSTKEANFKHSCIEAPPSYREQPLGFCPSFPIYGVITLALGATCLSPTLSTLDFLKHFLSQTKKQVQ